MSFFLGEESSEMLKDSYSDYLHESCVFPKLLEIFEKLRKAEEKPKDPMEFIRKELGDKPIPMEEILDMEQELEDATAEIRRLQLILKTLGLKYDEDESFISCATTADSSDTKISEH